MLCLLHKMLVGRVTAREDERNSFLQSALAIFFFLAKQKRTKHEH